MVDGDRAVVMRAAHPMAACGSVGATQGETGSCDVRDPLARTYHAGQPPIEEEVGVGRKMILLLGWLTRGVRFVSLS